MRVLVLDEWLPYPLISGKRLRSYHLLTRAVRRHDITYLCFEDPAGEPEAKAHLEALGFRLVTLKRRDPFSSASRLLYRAGVNLLSPRPLVMRKHFRRDFADRFLTLLNAEAFDLIHCEWTHYGAYVRNVRSHPLFLSSHNVETMPWERLCRHERDPLKKALLYLEWKKMQRFERQVCRYFHHAGAVSEQDGRQLRDVYGCDSVAVIPNGIDVAHYDFAFPELARRTLVFSASFDAFVNYDAAHYFLQAILPRIVEHNSLVRILFLGKDPPQFLRKYAHR
ncbi:MAG: glycosyltransferase, partial [Candidatus Eisenbacteria bacterium]